MRWYKFEKGNPIGIPQIKDYQICFYEHGKCYDEAFFEPEEVAKVMPFVDGDDSCVYANFKDGKSYLITFVPVEDL